VIHNPYDCILVAYAYRDGNPHELFFAFDEEAAELAYDEAVADERFGRAHGPSAYVAFMICGVPS
jgi:hypothetical protein